MKPYTLLLLCLIFSLNSVLAQEKFGISGSVADTTTNVKLVNTTIAVLNAKDSTLTKFTRASASGSFSISGLRPGKFILLVTYPGYADYVDRFTLDSSARSKDLGQINMILKSNLLADVLIKGKAAAIKIKGDTTEFNAASFTIQPNAKVEDLLKQLPGIQVDKDGKITAQGETVGKVLVDGEEFFGDDPTLVTKNLRGDMVDKVQLYDKKSDQATFTGVDDGVKTKTLNIKLKEDKKNGYFGKVDAGGDGDFHQEQVMFNAFKAKRKFSAYGTVGNTGKTGLDWEDSNKYASSNNVEVSDDGGIMIYGGREEIRYNGQGIPLAQTGGLHYDSKWNGDKESINANFKLGSITIDGTRNNLSQNNLPTGILNSNQDQVFNNYTNVQKVDAIYQIKIDSTTNLKVSVDGTLRNTRSNDQYDGINLRGTDSLQNISDRKLSNEGTSQNVNMSAFLTKKLKKAGRTLSLNLTNSYNEREGTGFLNSKNTFYSRAAGLDPTSNIDSTQTINQYKTDDYQGLSFNANLTYTEPITKNLSVVFNYSFGLNSNSSDRKSFNQSGAGNYDVLDNLFSNNFELRQYSNQGGAVFNYKKAKSVINFGGKITDVSFKQIDVINDKAYTRKFINLAPQASYTYRFSQQKSFRINYNGYTSQPSISAIQPIRVNTDPLNISIGNADLKPSFSSSVNANFNSYKVLSGQSIYASANYSLTSNSIVSNVVTDSAGKSTYQSVNISDKMPSNYYLYGYFSRQLNTTGLNAGITLNMSGNTSFNYINGKLNTTESNSYRGSLRFRQYVQKKYDINIAAGPTYNTGQSSIQKQVNNNGWGFNSDASFTVYLPGKVEISSDANYEFTEKTASFNQNFDRLIWNSSISKKFLKGDNLQLTLSGNDLLNQNVGFSRYAYGNNITQNSYTTIKRYFLFSLMWEFNKMGGGIKAPAN